MSKKNDPDLAPDASLATDIPDPEERQAQQLEYLGGEKDDIDDFDASDLDDGSDFNPGDEVPVTAEKDDDDDSDEDADDDSADEEDDDSADDDGDDDADADDDDDADGDDDDDDAEEEEDDDDEDSDGEGEDDDAEEEEEKPRGIPKHRFDKVNERAKRAEARVAELEAQQKAEEEAEEEAYDFDAAEKEYLELALEGDTDGALAKRKEINAAQKAAWTKETKQETRSEISQQELEADLNDMTSEAEQMFNEFNPEHEDFDQHLVNKTLTYYRGYLADGTMTPADAFVAGLADVIEQHGLKEVGAVEDTDDGKGDKRKPTGKKKSGGKKKQKAKEKSHQPVGGEGEGSKDAGVPTAKSIAEMSDDEFEALPDAALARLRGDIL